MYDIGSTLSALASISEGAGKQVDSGNITRKAKICPKPVSVGIGLLCPAGVLCVQVCSIITRSIAIFDAN